MFALVASDLRVALSLQAESRNAELALLLNKLQSEDAALRDSLAKMGSMNEALVQDKADLNTYILQVCMSHRFSAVMRTIEVWGACFLVNFNLRTMNPPPQFMVVKESLV